MNKSLVRLAALLSVVSLSHCALAAERFTQESFGGNTHSGKKQFVTVNNGTSVKSVIFISGDRINGIVLRGADGSLAELKGSLNGVERKPIELGEGEHLIGFRGLSSDGKFMEGIGVRKGWFLVQAVIRTAKGEHRFSEDHGSRGSGNIHLGKGPKLGFEVVDGMHPFEILAPEGQEVVGLHGETGQVLEYIGLVTQKW